MLSVNQMSAQIKLTEMWKATNDPQYPIKMKTRENQEGGMGARSGTQRDMTESGGSAQAKKSFTIDAAKVWNKASEKIRTAKSFAMAKKAIRAHCKCLPI